MAGAGGKAQAVTRRQGIEVVAVEAGVEGARKQEGIDYRHVEIGGAGLDGQHVEGGVMGQQNSVTDIVAKARQD